MSAGEVVIGSLSVLIGADASNLTKSTRTAEQSLQNLERTTSNVVNRMKNAFLALAGPAALGYLIKKSIDAVSEQKDLAERLNSTVEGVQVMQRAAQLAGLSLEEMNKAADRLQRKLGEASREAKGEAADAFRRLGLSAKDFAGLNIDERFALIMTKVKELGLSTTETADIIGKFGIRGGRLGTLFAEGAEGIDTARKQLKAFGVLLNDVDAAKVESAGDALTTFGLVAQGVGNALAVELSPFLVKAAEDFQNLAESTGGVGTAARRSVDAAIEIVVAFMNIGDQLKVEFNEWSEWALKAVTKITDAFKLLGNFNPLVKFAASMGEFVANAKATDTDVKAPFESLIMSKEELEKKLGRPLSGEAFKEWIKSAREAADQAAQIAADTKQDRAQDDEEFGLGKGGLGTKEKEALEKKLLAFKASLSDEAAAANIHRTQQLDQAKEFYEKGILNAAKYAELKNMVEQKFQEDRQKSIWDNFTSSYATELEILQHQQDEKMKKLTEFKDAEFLTEEQYAQQRNKMIEKYEMDKIEIQARGYSALAGIVDTSMSAISGIIDQEGKKGFTVMKAISMATALVKGYEAAVSAYAAGSKIGGPALGAVMAGIAAAGTAAIIAKLAGVGQGSTGTPSAAGGGGSAASSAIAQNQQEEVRPDKTVLIKGLNRKDFFSGDAVRDLVEAIADNERDGGRRVILAND